MVSKVFYNQSFLVLFLYLKTITEENEMKKGLALLLCTVLATGMLTGCGSSATTEEAPAAE